MGNHLFHYGLTIKFFIFTNEVLISKNLIFLIIVFKKNRAHERIY